MYKRQLSFMLCALLSCSASAQLQLQEAWVRALPPTQTSTAGYLVAVNSGSQPLTITGAQSTAAGLVEIHTTREVDGLMRMERVPQVTLAPGEQVQLAPGGVHLMMMKLPRMPEEGERVPLCLTVAGGEPVCTTADVRRSEGGGHQHHGHH